MSVYLTIAEAIRENQKKDLEVFTEFIDVSVDIVKGLGSIEKENKEIYATLDAEIMRFKQTKIGTDSLDMVLESNGRYQNIMQRVQLDFGIEARNQRLQYQIQDQQDRNKLANTYIEKNSVKLSE
ncbi:hypothetical protein FKG94_14290 [Exilibacterium tricleocarpae]|uniref:Uncharacterized protein n=1 Tax=Exilibacterium tricleocarpae TaxID=2591008 RepID=A0A545TM13_9GAMM|nr:hypothetical protein [Exilibacterium tricleocarpae]TQV78234.1 hypothetical protein FKG94_14290 [Exilibacterium tricleocarpae]